MDESRGENREPSELPVHPQKTRIAASNWKWNRTRNERHTNTRLATKETSSAVLSGARVVTREPEKQDGRDKLWITREETKGGEK